MTLSTAYLLTLSFVLFTLSLYLHFIVFNTGHCEATKFRFRTRDSKKTVSQLRVVEVGKRETGSHRVSIVAFNANA